MGLDGDRKDDLSTMAWESVLEPGDTGQPAAPDAPGDEPGASAAPQADDTGLGEIRLQIPSLDESDVADSPAAPMPEAPTARPIVEPGPLPLPADDPGPVDTALSFSIPGIHDETSPPSPAPPAEAPSAPIGPEVEVPPISIPDVPDGSMPDAPESTVAPAPSDAPPAPVPSSSPVPPPPPPSADVFESVLSSPPPAEPPPPSADEFESVLPSPSAPPPPEPPPPSADVFESVLSAPPAPEPPPPAADVFESALSSPPPPEPAPPAPTALESALSSPSPPAPAAALDAPGEAPVAPETPSAPSPAAGEPTVAPPPDAPPAPAAAAPVVPQYQLRPQPAPPVPHYGAPGAMTPAASKTRPGGRSGAGRAASTLFVLLLIGGLVAAAVVFGRPYLFPDEWDAAARPYAEEVENALGQEFVEPVTVNAEAPAMYEARRSAELLGDWKSELPVWRALGLANGGVDQTAVDELLQGWMPALYSRADGQLYHDSSLAGAPLDSQLTFVMAQAALDQQTNWSSSPLMDTLDGAALVTAHVHQQATATQLVTEHATPIEGPDPAPLVYLPPVLGYRVMAPAMFVELLPEIDPAAAAPNPLAAEEGPGPWTTVAPVLSNEPTLADGEVAVRDAVAQEKSFWYLALAAYVDAPLAYAAAESIVESALTVTDRTGRSCVAATFSGGDLTQTATLGSALGAWVAAAPAALSATTTVLPDGTLQLSSCDPGVGFENGARFGTARELLGIRMGELATAAALTEPSPAELDEALREYAQSSIPMQLAALPFETSPADLADAARTAVASPPAPEPGAEPGAEPVTEPAPPAEPPGG